MNHDEILAWLREEDESRLNDLWELADAARKENVGDEVHLRGLIEISNYCVRQCLYCGIRADNTEIGRYRMTAKEIMDCVREAVSYGYGTVVLQSGEDYGMTRDWLADLVRRIKSETDLAVTLSLGERPDEDLIAWKEAGANRYLLRFETSDRGLYERIHPALPGRKSDRFAILRRLKQLGYETGSGVMIGIPGQTYESLTQDVETFRELDLDMIGVGPYIPHPHTPLGKTTDEAPDQAPNTEEMTYKVVALARIVRPDANIPSTTALATLNPVMGREQGLSRGANVVMPNLTPSKYSMMYEIYPAKVCMTETAMGCRCFLQRQIVSMGRVVGGGPGGRRRKARRVAGSAR